jgi:hypothetical protein
MKLSAKGSPVPLKRVGLSLAAFALLVFLTVDFREIYLKSWMFELFSPTHSVELSVSRVRK